MRLKSQMRITLASPTTSQRASHFSNAYHLCGLAREWDHTVASQDKLVVQNFGEHLPRFAFHSLIVYRLRIICPLPCFLVTRIIRVVELY